MPDNEEVDYLNGRAVSDLTNSELWAAAKTEFLDVSKPRPKMAALAIKYRLNLEHLIKCSVQQGWERTRAQAEVAAALVVTPETRVAVVQQVDTALLRTAVRVANEAGDLYLEMLAQIRAIDTDQSTPAEVIEETDAETGKKRTKPKLKPSLNSKLALLNTLTAGFGSFAQRMHELGYVITPETADQGSEQLKKAVPVLAASQPPPPPLTLTAQPPPPPPPSSTESARTP